MKCGQAEKWMDAALDELSGGTDLVPAGWTAQRRAELEMHLSGCPVCRAQWDVLRSAEAVLRVPKPVPAPESLLVDFRQRLAAEEQRQPRAVQQAQPRSSGWRWMWPLGSLAAAGVAAAAVFMFNIQAPLPSAQKTQSTVNRRSDAPPRTPVASAPQDADRSLAASKVATPWFKPRSAPDLRGRPAPQELADASSLDGSVRGVTPPEPERLSIKEQSTNGSLGLAQSQSGTRDLDRLASADAQVKDTSAREALRKDATVTEQESKLQTVPTRSEPLHRLKQAVSKEQLELAEKQNLYARTRGEANYAQTKQYGIAAGENAPVTLATKPQNQGVTYSNNTVQTAQTSDYYYAQVPAEPTPVEFTVSAAVLNALQRPVELRTATVQVQDLALQLSTEADVEVKVDPQVARLNVTVDEAGVPLWRVLEDVARQTQVEIYPSDNSLLLRRSKPAASVLALGMQDKVDVKRDPLTMAKKEATFRQRAMQTAPKVPVETPAAPAAHPAPPAPGGPAGPAGPSGRVGAAGGGGNGFGGFAGGSAPKAALGGSARGMSPPGGQLAPFGSPRYAYSSRQPDRKFWPAAWGNLPERGFEVPTAEELPPLVLAPVQVGKSLANEVPQVRARRSPPAKPPAKKPRSTR